MIIRNELKKYNKDVSKKKEVVLLNKIDLINEDEKEKIKRNLNKFIKKNFAVFLSFKSQILIILLGPYVKNLTQN